LNAGAIALVSVLAVIALAYIARWWQLEGAGGLKGARQPRLTDALVGLVTNFFDTLGIGSFAPTTAYFKLRARMPDDQIPGTLNAGQALPTITQALIFIAIVSVDLTTLISMILAAVLVRGWVWAWSRGCRGGPSRWEWAWHCCAQRCCSWEAIFIGSPEAGKLRRCMARRC
jgi:hypothetical protein